MLEMLHHGDRNKDLVENVERYARLGVPEYFVFDKSRDEVLGYRLSGQGSGRYTRVVPQRGRHASLVQRVQPGRPRREATILRRDAEEQRTRAEGALAGLRDALVALLEARGVAASDTLRARLRACDDVATLKRWLARAVTARRADDVLEG